MMLGSNGPISEIYGLRRSDESLKFGGQAGGGFRDSLLGSVPLFLRVPSLACLFSFSGVDAGAAVRRAPRAGEIAESESGANI
jgi:hypothetical protein